MCFEFLHRPVLVTVDGLVAVFLVGSPDDKDNRTIYNTLFHDSKALASSKETIWFSLSRVDFQFLSYYFFPFNSYKGCSCKYAFAKDFLNSSVEAEERTENLMSQS